MNCRNSATPNPRRTWNWLKAGLFGAALALSTVSVAQLNYTFNFDANATGWTGAFSRITGTTACGGSGGSMYKNQYSSSPTGALISPSVGNAVGGVTTISYTYKVANWSGNTVPTPTPWGSFAVQFAPSLTGPWTTIATVSDETQTAGTCIAKSHTFTPAPGPVYIRWNATWSAGDYYLNFDNVSLVEAPPPACTGTPTAGTVAGPTTICPNISFSLSLSGSTIASALSYQWQRADDADFLENLQNIGTSSILTTTQSTAKWYRCIVTCTEPGGGTSTSVPAQVAVTDYLTCYCTPTSVYGCTDGDVIARVILNTLDNNSGTGCPSGTAGYSNYTASSDPQHTTVLQAGASYSCTVYAGQYDEGYAAWIDYNDDGIFDNATERIGYSPALVTGSGSAGVLGSSVTFPISLSCSPPLGQHRLRVRAMYNVNGPLVTPCTANSYGEVEDYLITISTADPCPQPSSLSATNVGMTSAQLNWNAGCVETVWDLHFQLAGAGAPGTPSNPGVTVDSLVLGSLTPGTAYEFYVRADCDVNGTSVWTGPIAFSTIPANNVCSGAVIHPLASSSTLTINGNNAGATDVDALGMPHTWEAFTLSECATTLSLSFCGNAPIQSNAYVNLFLGCPYTTYLANTTFNNTACGDGNYTLFYNNLPAGTYYYPVMADGPSTGPYTLTIITGAACPVNTDCAAAIDIPSLPVNGQAVVCGTANLLSASSVPIACGAASNDYKGGNEALYTFVPATSGNYVINLSGQTWSSIFVYANACPSNGGVCMGSTGSSSASQTLVVSLTAGTTYYLWFDTYPSPDSPCPGTFSINPAPPPPANDDCVNATAIVAGSNLSCSGAVSGTISSATASTDANTCVGTASDDVWYSFVATSTSHRITLTSTSGQSDLVHALYTGTCGSLTLVAGSCSDPETSNQTGLFIGTTYYIRVYSYTSTPNQFGNFTLCVGTVPAPGAECDGGTVISSLPVIDQPVTCGGNVLTADNVLTLCGSASANYLGGNEAIYSFTPAVSDNYVINLSGQTWTAIFVYSNACPTNGGTCVNSIGSSTASKQLVVPMTAGTTYYIFFDTWPTPNSPCPGTFSLYVQPPPPANEECANAQGLTVYEEGACVATAGTTVSAPTEAPTGSCMNPDYVPHPFAVHYSFVATGFANVVTINVPTALDGQFNFVVRDACGGAEKACFFPASGAENVVAGLTPGATYYIQVNTWLESTFNICVTESDIEIPANDDCANATELTVYAHGECVPYLDNNQAASSSGANASCLNPAVTILDVWYTFTATDETQYFTLEHGGSDGYGVTLYTGCGGTELYCTFIDALESGSEIPLNGLVAGNDYILRLGSMAGSAGNVELCLTGPPPPLTCGADFVDQGGPGGQVPASSTPAAGDYLNSSNSITKVCPTNAGDLAEVTFTEFFVEPSYDALYVFDGDNVSAPMIASGNPAPNANNIYGAGGWWEEEAPYNVAPNVVRATNPGGCLTFAFTSDGSWTAMGWEAVVGCFTPPTTCANAQAISCGASVTGFTNSVPHSQPTVGCPFNGAPSTGGQNWFVYTPTADEAVNLSTCGLASFDTRISVFSGSDCSALTCVAVGDDGPGCANGTTNMVFNAFAGNTYYIMVHGAGNAEGTFQLLMNCGPQCAPAPANDACAGAAAISVQANNGSAVPTVQDNTCATLDAPTSCSGTSLVQGLWYTFNSGSTGVVLVNLEGGLQNGAYTASTLHFALYDGACGGLGAGGPVACVSNAAGSNVVEVTPNTDYKLLVYNAGPGEQGSFGLTVTVPAPYDVAIDQIVSPLEGLLCSNSVAPVVIISNQGGNDLTSVTFSYSIGGVPSSYVWTGNIPYLGTQQITLPAIVAPNGEHTLNIQALPTGQTDDDSSDNNASVDITIGGQSVNVVIRTDANPEMLSWSILDQDYNEVATGSGYSTPNTVVTTNLCLPAPSGSACYMFFLSDGFGDGLCCNNGNGYWELRTTSGGALLRDRFEASIDGFSSPAAVPTNPGYGFAHAFCLPAGPANIATADCGVFSNNLDSRVDCNNIPGVARYQFDFSNPDAGFRRLIAVPRPWVKFNEMVTSPLTAGVIYFARVRADQGVANTFDDDHFGTGCEMAIDPNQTQGCTSLIDNISLPTHSCGVVKTFGGNDRIWAKPVAGATQYRFRFANPNEGFVRTLVTTSYICQLNWVSLPLQNGHTYQVQVESFLAGIWKGYCGNTCLVSILNNAPAMQQADNDATQATSGVLDQQPTLWPNPTADNRVNIAIRNIADQQQHITVDIFDTHGRVVAGYDFRNNGPLFNSILDLPQDVASGIYMVRVRVNETEHNLRLSVR